MHSEPLGGSGGQLQQVFGVRLLVALGSSRPATRTAKLSVMIRSGTSQVSEKGPQAPQHGVKHQDGEDCALFCDPDFKGLLSADEICATVAGAGARCLRSNDFYSDAGADDIGFCVPASYFP